jgi:5-(carboxyamino)imidazole ribonucleotide synthase
MLAPGQWIGILGGGQLARMLALAAAPLGLKVHIFAPDGDCPAGDVCAARTIAAYDDLAALSAFGRSVDIVTYEFENVPLVTARHLAAFVPIHPNPQALAIAQDRLTEKDSLNQTGLPTTTYAAINRSDDIEPALAHVGLPAVIKTRRLGYDGKGQALVRSIDDARRAFAEMAQAPAIAEGFVGFDREISVIVARSADGQSACYDPTWNQHGDHILRRSLVPSGCSRALESAAIAQAKIIADALDYIGVLGVEFFVCGEKLLINEIAPRVHNSGHWTQDGCAVSQFEQHIRCIAGWPLGPVVRHFDVIMDNLIGDDVLAWPQLAKDPSARIHLYGKGNPSPGRKMGHVNRLYPMGQRPD